jgi:two-component system, chemotaxis family, protein-glutamate methylesterase/glutaminase
MPHAQHLARRDLIVVGASAGGVEALRGLCAGLPEDLPAAVLLVQHVSDGISLLPRILSRAGPLSAVHAEDGQEIRPGCVYVAPPERHLMVEPGRLRVTAGPHENRHRPAVDPLFRTAARVYGPRVIGVVLTGSGDDGTAGLLEIKRLGGTAVVQSPEDALSPSMPSSALEFVRVDHCLPLREIAPLLARLARDPAPLPPQVLATAGSVPRPGAADPAPAPGEQDVRQPEEPRPAGPLEGFTCPHCRGHLWEVHDEGLLRFQCRVGHVLSADSMLAQKHANVEASLWAALNLLEENAALTRRMSERAHDLGHRHSAERLCTRAEESSQHARVLRDLLSTGMLAPLDHVDGAAGMLYASEVHGEEVSLA